MGKRALGVSLLLVATAFGQSDRGAITGTIQDPGGAVISKRRSRHEISRPGRLSGRIVGNGNYEFAQLPAGTYELTVTFPGFESMSARSCR
jgi:hypothetical protein